MIKTIESQLTIAAVLLDMYQKVSDRAKNQQISKNEMGAHLVNLKNISKGLSEMAEVDEALLVTLPEAIKTDLEDTLKSFELMFEHLKKYYDKIPTGYEPPAESMDKAIPEKLSWMSWNNRLGEC